MDPIVGTREVKEHAELISRVRKVDLAEAPRLRRSASGRVDTANRGTYHVDVRGLTNALIPRRYTLIAALARR